MALAVLDYTLPRRRNHTHSEVEKKLGRVIKTEERVFFFTVHRRSRCPMITSSLKLTEGEVRRAPNMLRVCRTADDPTGETEVYGCIGEPTSHIETIINSAQINQLVRLVRLRNANLPNPSPLNSISA